MTTNSYQGLVKGGTGCRLNIWGTDSATLLYAMETDTQTCNNQKSFSKGF